MIEIRRALQSDKQDILSFCRNTFDWGDYIDRVWDQWLAERHGQLLVVEKADAGKVGLAHVALCPRSQSIWIEGIRVHPACRRSGVATALIEEMIDYGKRNGSSTALAIVAKDNAPSKRLMENCGFSAISEWAYHSIANRKAQERTPHSTARFASEADTDAVMDYLDGSRIYRLAAKKYVTSWRWYPLDSETVENLVKSGKVIVAGTDELAGVAVINDAGYWDRRNVLQIVYLDSEKISVLRNIIAFVTEIFANKKSYEWLQLFFQLDEKISSVVSELQTAESERFLLYSKVFSG